MTKVNCPELCENLCAKKTMAKLLPEPCVCRKILRARARLRAASVARIAWFTPNTGVWRSPLQAALCSEKSVKFSTKSKSLVGSHSPRIITSKIPARLVLALDPLHSVKRSQSAVSDPRGCHYHSMRSAGVIPEQRRNTVLQMLVARQVLIERLPSGNARFFELNDDKRQTVYKTNQIRTAGIKSPRWSSGSRAESRWPADFPNR